MKLLALTATTLIALSAACSVQDASEPTDPAKMTKEQAQKLSGKADGFDWCEALDWYGDGICDAWCPQPDPDCGGDPEPSCASIGGQCLSSPIDVTFAADCEADFDMVDGDGTCGDVINLSCCVPGDDGGGEEPTCASLGGQCLSSPIDVTFPANCDADFGMVDGDGSCGDVINLSCCLPDEGDSGDDAGSSCAEVGGQCLSSPIDVTFGADCEGDFGLGTREADCPFFNQSCCV